MLGIRLRSFVTVGVEVFTSICILSAEKILVVLSGVGETLGSKDGGSTGLGTEVIGV